MNENLQNDKKWCFPYVALTYTTLSWESRNKQFNEVNIIRQF